MLSILQDDGLQTLPTSFDQKLAITADGIVTLSGADAIATFHGNMASGKNLMFATGTVAGGAQALWVLRKRVPGVTFAAADVANVAFAYHAISAGSSWGWEYGDGTTNASGALTIDHTWDVDGAVTPPPAGFATLTIDTVGVVGFAEAPGLMSGVMAADKKSLFLLNTPTPGTPPEVQLIVVLLTRTGFTSADLEGRYSFHMLYSGSSTATSSWYRGGVAINAQGVTSITSFTSSSGSTAIPPSYTVAIDAGGNITRADDASYHSHMAWNRDFTVLTRNATNNPAIGVLSINAR
jgi:hypothetical protein